MPGSKKLLWLLLCLLCIVYVRYYITPNPTFQIVQLPLASLDTKHLFEKSPIILQERLVDPIDFTTKTFKFMYLYKRITNEIQKEAWMKCNGRFVVIVSHDDRTVLTLCHPTTPPDKDGKSARLFIDIPLRKHQCMILPNLWYYKTKQDQSILMIELHDLMSLLTNAVS